MSTTSVKWVAGLVDVGSAISNYRYKNHNYSRCGESYSQLMCGNNYYVNSTFLGQNEYSVNDKQTNIEACAPLGRAKCPADGCGLDYSKCRNIGGVQAQVQWASVGNGDGGQNTLGTDSTLACLYPLATFNDLETVLDFEDAFGSEPSNMKDPYTRQILPYFCLTQTTVGCPKNPATGVRMTACSRFVSEEPNNPCPAWLTNIAQQDKSTADIALSAYCKAYNTPDCLCINRFVSPVYQAMSTGQTATTDSCWWTPCQDTFGSPSAYLVNSEIQPCSTDTVQICNNVAIAVGGNSTGLTFNPQFYTTCDLTPTNNSNQSNTTTNSGGLWSFWWIFLIMIVLIVIVVLILIFSGRKGTK